MNESSINVTGRISVHNFNRTFPECYSHISVSIPCVCRRFTGFQDEVIKSVQCKHWWVSHRKWTANVIRSSKRGRWLYLYLVRPVCLMKAALLCSDAYQNSKHLRSASYKSSYDTVSILSADAAHNGSLFQRCEREKVQAAGFYCPLSSWGFMEKLSCDLHASCKTFPVDFTSYSTRR